MEWLEWYWIAIIIGSALLYIFVGGVIYEIFRDGDEIGAAIAGGLWPLLLTFIIPVIVVANGGRSVAHGGCSLVKILRKKRLDRTLPRAQARNADG